MRIVVTGKGGPSGSWKVRGEQLGAAIGADVIPNCTNFADYDLIIVVKRTPHNVINAVQASGKPWVYDIVDAWPQGGTIGMGRTEAVRWLQKQLSLLAPTGVVFGTGSMRVDADYQGPSIVLPHHSWSRYLEHQPVIREQVQVVGYEGGEQYLGRWHGMLQRECTARGWRLEINGDMRQADIGIAVRDSGGYPARHWKPGTKLSNLHALGIPAICSPEDGAVSVSCGFEDWMPIAPDDHALRMAFDRLAPHATRLAISQKMRAAAIPVQSVAERYLTWLESL